MPQSCATMPTDGFVRIRQFCCEKWSLSMMGASRPYRSASHVHMSMLDFAYPRRKHRPVKNKGVLEHHHENGAVRRLRHGRHKRIPAFRVRQERPVRGMGAFHRGARARPPHVIGAMLPATSSYSSGSTPRISSACRVVSSVWAAAVGRWIGIPTNTVGTTSITKGARSSSEQATSTADKAAAARRGAMAGFAAIIVGEGYLIAQLRRVLDLEGWERPILRMLPGHTKNQKLAQSMPNSTKGRKPRPRTDRGVGERDWGSRRSSVYRPSRAPRPSGRHRARPRAGAGLRASGATDPTRAPGQVGRRDREPRRGSISGPRGSCGRRRIPCCPDGAGL